MQRLSRQSCTSLTSFQHCTHQLTYLLPDFIIMTKNNLLTKPANWCPTHLLYNIWQTLPLIQIHNSYRPPIHLHIHDGSSHNPFSTFTLISIPLITASHHSLVHRVVTSPHILALYLHLISSQSLLPWYCTLPFIVSFRAWRECRHKGWQKWLPILP